jgi:hypothetical protein
MFIFFLPFDDDGDDDDEEEVEVEVEVEEEINEILFLSFPVFSFTSVYYYSAPFVSPL